MNAHVDHQRRVMFVESAEAAQQRLEALVKQVEAMMSERVMEVFVAMRGITDQFWVVQKKLKDSYCPRPSA